MKMEYDENVNIIINEYFKEGVTKLPPISKFFSLYNVSESFTRGYLNRMAKFNLIYTKNRSGIVINEVYKEIFNNKRIDIKLDFLNDEVVAKGKEMVGYFQVFEFIEACRVFKFDIYGVFDSKKLLMIILHIFETCSCYAEKKYKFNVEKNIFEITLDVFMTKGDSKVMKIEYSYNSDEYKFSF